MQSGRSLMEGTARKRFAGAPEILADAFHFHGVGLAVDDDGQVTGTGGAAYPGGDAVVNDGHGRRGRRSRGGSGVHLHGASSLGSGFCRSLPPAAGTWRRCRSVRRPWGAPFSASFLRRSSMPGLIRSAGRQVIGSLPIFSAQSFCTSGSTGAEVRP